ncbi:GNAT family N-acetyltransferase [Lysinibacillus xylanilyticus]|uniref:GNAT family N-acetyltransferase n=1 Tax=Lysinibacillus xylanilyticus TaxID=582475 RepID=UPI002B24A7D5|nr:GNAT family N-acetyltransferase [Lysinibacillus xylanilyticus]MEB2298313.1 GNAT family N-acetyltransferase [Lysinibacillus xylanilyticus]
MLVREAIGKDAEQVIAVIKNAEESNFMLFRPGERKLETEQFTKFIDNLNNNNHSALFIAEIEKTVVGYLIVQGNHMPSSVSHRAYIVVGIHSEYRGQKIGTALFSHLDYWAKEKSMHRLELTVMANNTAGIALYKKMGFEIEGTKRHSLYVDGEYMDEYYMSKIF